jgi:thiol-disulfide isomerase/thioredoxin
MYGPTFDRVKQDLQDIIEFTEINVEQDTENLSAKYKVRGIPHTVIVEDGEEIKSQSGGMGEEQLKEFILN